MRRDHRLYWLISGYFLCTSLVSRFAWSALQLSWDTRFSLVLILLTPLLLVLPTYIWRSYPIILVGKVVYFKVIRIFTLLFLFIFCIQCMISLPPILASDPNEARLGWGIPIVHVLTEMCFRLYILLFLSSKKAMRKSTFSVSVFICILAYTIVVVTRSFMFEIFLYSGLFAIFRLRSFSMSKLISIFILTIVLIQAFLVFSRFRQGNGFDVSKYGEMTVSSPVTAWIFGYTLVNFDNLYMVVEQEYKNGSPSNVLGPTLGFFQLRNYVEVDDYPYVGKFNLGTAIRPFVLDFGLEGGIIVFGILWILFARFYFKSKSSSRQLLAKVVVVYVGLHLPMTSRMEIPTYFLPYVLALKLVR